MSQVSFLQMMGRVRVREGDQVNLYVQKYSPVHVRSFAAAAARQFQFLAQFSRFNELTSKSYFRDWREANILDPRHRDEEQFLTNHTKAKLIDELNNRKECRNGLLTVENTRPFGRRLELEQAKDLRVNRMSLLFYLGQVYFYKRVLSPYEGDPNYFLKEQLSWIGKTYDPTCWIDHGKVEDQLRTYLEEVLSEGVPMDREAQEDFKENCTSILLRMRQLPTELKSARNHHGEDMNPLGKSTLNRIFVRLGLPYEIRSKVSKNSSGTRSPARSFSIRRRESRSWTAKPTGI